MTVIEGKLVRQGKRIMVELPTKSGKALFPIPEMAKRFRDEDVKEDTVASVTRDNVNRIVEVSIPGARVVAPVVTQPAPNRSNNFGKPTSTYRTGANRGVRDLPKATPEVIGGPFTNPYTFIPFDKRTSKERREPTLLTADELGSSESRYTGVLCVTVKTRSPLMTCDPIAKETLKNGHKVLRALTIENDVIVPATGVRGALRTLLTILTGGTLGYVDPTAYLIQGRDAKLGPATPNDRTGNVPPRVFLGEVVQPGSLHRPGRIRLGKTLLVRTSDLKHALNTPQLNRSPAAKPVWFGLDTEGRPINPSPSASLATPWRMRLSGTPVGGMKMEERKREGLFQPSDKVIEVAAEKWIQYQGRNAGGERSELRKGDLVWLEPTRVVAQASREIQTDGDIESLQWSRWGKTGEKLECRIPTHLHPDSWDKKAKSMK